MEAGVILKGRQVRTHVLPQSYIVQTPVGNMIRRNLRGPYNPQGQQTARRIHTAEPQTENETEKPQWWSVYSATLWR